MYRHPDIICDYQYIKYHFLTDTLSASFAFSHDLRRLPLLFLPYRRPNPSHETSPQTSGHEGADIVYGNGDILADAAIRESKALDKPCMMFDSNVLFLLLTMAGGKL